MAKNGISRRRFFADAGKFATGAALGMVILGIGSRTGIQGRAQEVPNWPWPYEALDLEEVALQGYEGYYEGKCSFGAFHAIVGALADKVGYPFNIIPTEMLYFGHGGVVGWGNYCGALNGACAAINLVTNKEGADALIKELNLWYEQTPIPLYKPSSPKVEIPDDAVSIAGSTLCHVSVTRWCNATGFKAKSKERSERCARLTAQVAQKAAELLNLYHAGAFTPEHTMPASVAECGACHGPGGPIENVKAKMDCLMCHERHP